MVVCTCPKVAKPTAPAFGRIYPGRSMSQEEEASGAWDWQTSGYDDGDEEGGGFGEAAKEVSGREGGGL
jgi:hypothetical protein